MNDATNGVSTARKLTSHQVNGANEQLEISVVDAPGSGGASHLYVISGMNTKANESIPFAVDHPVKDFPVLFQNGPIGEKGVNGVTHEALLAIIEDRLTSFQAGPYACEENAEALRSVQRAMSYLKRRTEARLARGVEGTHTV